MPKISPALHFAVRDPPSGTVVPDNTVTLRGDLESTGPVIVGRSSGMAGMTTNGKVIQESGLFTIPNGNMISATPRQPAAPAGNGNGVGTIGVEGWSLANRRLRSAARRRWRRRRRRHRPIYHA